MWALGDRRRRAAAKLRSDRILWGGTALGLHERRAPSAQTIVDAFGHEWLSRFPDHVGVTAGESPAFDDPRVHWAIPRLRPEGRSVLELGPLEGGHTYMLERAGAASVVAVESNRRAFLRCLATRELTGLDRAKFLCGDFIEYLRGEQEIFDIGIACGVLYHLLDPVELIALLSRRVRRLLLWTHYHERQLHAGSRRFSAATARVTEGFEHRLHPRRYSRVGLRVASFPGGANRSASWLDRTDLFAALEHFGWTDIEVGPSTFEPDPGPALTLVARNSALST